VKLVLFVVALALVGFIFAVRGDAHLIRYPDRPADSQLENRERSQELNLGHARYVCRRGGGEHRRWACRAKVWIAEELEQTRRALRPVVVAPTRARMIAAGEQVAAESVGDPWPNCPDPHAGGGSWDDTVKCENRGIYESAGLAAAWRLDPPGYYCGPLQLDPIIWRHVIRKWGVPC
jgi:hypothetical protein